RPPRPPAAGGSLKELRGYYGKKGIVHATDRRGRSFCYDSERGSFGRVPCNPVTPPQAPAAPPSAPAAQPTQGHLPAPRSAGHAGRKYVARLERFVNLAVRRRVLHGLRNEKQLADA